MNLTDILNNQQWEIVHTEQWPGREARLISIDDISLSAVAKNYLDKKFSAGVYEHQKLAIQAALNGQHVCLTTATASGKSLAFYVAGIELLAKSPDARIVAIYPLKALGKEQASRWAKALEEAGLEAQVGRIDGQIPIPARAEILRNSRVLVVTPDVMHAWMFSHLHTDEIRDFLKQLRLVVVDEVHSYSGVFGSNSGYLFRRLRHILELLGRKPLFFCASATVADSPRHLNQLFGLDFEVIDQSHDSSPRQPIRIDLVRPPLHQDLFTAISSLLSALAKDDSLRCITFVDSRKQTELLASIMSRERENPPGSEAQPDAEPDLNWDHLQRLNILPYRAGFEEKDRLMIQERLSEGSLAGVVSTSALELGIDIPHLTVGILVGVPSSSTSFFQRIGRIGRRSPGRIVVVSRGNVYDEALFANPKELLNRPPAEGALYLENKRIQYIHALCLARRGGEHDQILSAESLGGLEQFFSPIDWPEGFFDLCVKERAGDLTPDLKAIKAEAGNDPNHVYPLRDVEVQFKVRQRLAGQFRNVGDLSHSQLMREAYPGAVYYYTTMAYRVVKVNTRSREVQVRHEKKYTTSPSSLPILIFPNFAPGNIFGARSFGQINAVECNLLVREVITGYAEKRGRSTIAVPYPPDAKATGVFFDQPRFSRNYFTTGIILTHPAFNRDRAEIERLGSLLFEAFLMIVAFERRDVSFAVDKHRTELEQLGLERDARFIAIYDQAYGSLRLTNRLLQGNTLRLTIAKAIELGAINPMSNAYKKTVETLELLLTETGQSPLDHVLKIQEEGQAGADLVKILLPGSKGLALSNSNKEFQVQEVFWDAKSQRLSYRGRYVDQEYLNATTSIILPVEGLAGVPGESTLGYYDPERKAIRKS